VAMSGYNFGLKIKIATWVTICMQKSAVKRREDDIDGSSHIKCKTCFVKLVLRRHSHVHAGNIFDSLILLHRHNIIRKPTS